MRKTVKKQNVNLSISVNVLDLIHQATVLPVLIDNEGRLTFYTAFQKEILLSKFSKPNRGLAENAAKHKLYGK